MTQRAVDEAIARLQAGDLAEARQRLDALLARPGIEPGVRVAALKVRSRVREGQRDAPGAIADLEAALALAPADARACNELGVLRMDAGDLDAGMACFARATTLEPAYARAWNNLGIAQRRIGDAAAAEASFARATAADPRYALAFANLGAARRSRGDDAGAEAALAQALALDPAHAPALSTLAALRRQQGALDAAASLYARAAQAAPRDGEAPLLLAQTLAERDDVEQARKVYEAALARDPGLLRAAIGRELTLPMVAESGAALAASRARYAAGLARLEAELPQRAAHLSRERRIDELRWTNFLLAYQGEDDTALQCRYGDLCAQVVGTAPTAPQAAPATSRAPAAGRCIRIGFVSAFFRDGTVGRYFESWLTGLPPGRFQVHVYCLNGAQDALTERVCAAAHAVHHWAALPPSRMAAMLEADALDVLVYPELGMDARTFALATQRLARRQCAAWGHPVTTGLREIDVYFTAEAMEPPGARAQYRERLVGLPGLGTRYAMPVAPADATRARFGLPADAPLLLCPQSLFKIHPDNDPLFARILAAAPRARLVLFEGRHPAITARYLARLDAALSAAGIDRPQRVSVVSQCGHTDYLRLNTLCAAMLDTRHWSGGNTSLDALACALPIVTLPGKLMRGRQSAAMLALVGAEDTIARDESHYVELAARLAGDQVWRDALSARIGAGQTRLFDDPRPVAALAQALEALVDA